jgi:hypothetical protein
MNQPDVPKGMTPFHLGVHGAIVSGLIFVVSGVSGLILNISATVPLGRTVSGTVSAILFAVSGTGLLEPPVKGVFLPKTARGDGC